MADKRSNLLMCARYHAASSFPLFSLPISRNEHELAETGNQDRINALAN